MLGNAVGSLSVEASTDNGTIWISIFSKSGSQGSNWNIATISLDAYTGVTVQLRFHGLTGNSWQGDIVIDDVKISEASRGENSDTSI